MQSGLTITHVAQGLPSVDSTGANAAGTPITADSAAAAAAPASTTRATGGGPGSFPGMSGASALALPHMYRGA